MRKILASLACCFVLCGCYEPKKGPPYYFYGYSVTIDGKNYKCLSYAVDSLGAVRGGNGNLGVGGSAVQINGSSPVIRIRMYGDYFPNRDLLYDLTCHSYIAQKEILASKSPDHLR